MYRRTLVWRAVRRLQSITLRLLVRNVRMATERHGTSYGAWVIPSGILLDGESVVYSGGVGEDATFDEAIIGKYGCTVFAFDPTPRAIVYAETIDDPRFHFLPVGLWSEDSLQEFRAPANPERVNHSIGSSRGPTGGFTAECRSLESLMRELRHSDLALLKLDIEGAEYEVLQALDWDRVRPRALCFEVHGGLFRSLRLVRFLRRQGYVPVAVDGWNVTMSLVGAGVRGPRQPRLRDQAAAGSVF